MFVRSKAAKTLALMFPGFNWNCFVCEEITRQPLLLCVRGRGLNGVEALRRNRATKLIERICRLNCVSSPFSLVEF